MNDLLDDAQTIEERAREAAIARARGHAGGGGDGICIACQAPIPQARLAANPNAKRCISCQEDFEEDASHG